MSAPDLIAPVLGFRQWFVAGAGLRSIAYDETWHAPTLVARCALGAHPGQDAPASACSCGIHAWYEQCPRSASAGTRDCVAGAVLLWGSIELHASGMRAQHCRVAALALPLSRGRKRDRVAAVADRFGLPALRHRDLGAFARGLGAPVPPGLRPPPRAVCDLAAVRPRRADGRLAGTPHPRSSR